ncbi:helix-turn-helix domain-containing protein [Leucobacter albus]|uniref:Helix-turn-helix domain-containing protein n=2 Tax=Leucobacter albus TaxID=272210 RepID=A0ABW3TJ06_9MICO
MLYAVLRGSAMVRVGDDALDLHADAGVWVPAGETVAVTPQPGAIVLPIPVAGAGRTVTTRLGVPPHAHVALLRAFTEALGHLDGAQGAARLELRGGSPEPLAAPPALRSPELRPLAELLTAHPELGLQAAAARAVPGWSVRTLQRRFLAETGWTVAAWVRRQRVRIAAELITDGRDLEWVAHRVGYRSFPGFIRAFSEATGMTPGQWRQKSAEGCMGVGPSRPELESGEGGDGHGAERRTWARVNGAHVAVWAAVGGARLIIAGRALTLAEGEAVIIPAGTPNEFRVPSGSLLVPLGFRSALTGPIGAPLTAAHIGGLDSMRMLEAVLASYTRVGVTDVDPDRGFAAVLAGSERLPATTGSELLGRAANLFVREPELSLAAASERLGLSERELCRVVGAHTGEQFAAWLRLLRMTRARNQLGDGETPSEISRELGYSHLPAFSRAFRAVHGAGPTGLGVPNLAPTRAAWGREMRLPASAL